MRRIFILMSLVMMVVIFLASDCWAYYRAITPDQTNSAIKFGREVYFKQVKRGSWVILDGKEWTFEGSCHGKFAADIDEGVTWVVVFTKFYLITAHTHKLCKKGRSLALWPWDEYVKDVISSKVLRFGFEIYGRDPNFLEDLHSVIVFDTVVVRPTEETGYIHTQVGLTRDVKYKAWCDHYYNESDIPEDAKIKFIITNGSSGKVETIKIDLSKIR